MSKSFILLKLFVKIVIAKDVYIGREEVEKRRELYFGNHVFTDSLKLFNKY